MSNTILEGLRDQTPAKDDRRILNFQLEGYRVLVGKNSFSNERIVAEHPHRGCLWFHAVAARGSHVILCIEGLGDPPMAVLQYAASLAKKHSHSNTTSVSVSQLRDVIKPEGSGPGIWKSRKDFIIEVDE